MANDRKVGNLLVTMRAEMGQLRMDVKEMESTFKSGFSSIERVAANAGRAILGALSVGAIVNFGRQLMAVGDQLSDLSDQTGLTVAVLGGIKPVVEQNNSSLEAFAKGIVRAQKTIGENSKETQQTFKLLGLSIQELIGLSPDQFLQRLAEGLGTVENRNERVAIATRLFGKSAAELIPTLLTLAEKGLPKLSKEAEEGYKALGRLADKMVDLMGKFLNFNAAIIGMLSGAGGTKLSEEIDTRSKGIETLLSTMKSRGQTPENNSALALQQSKLVEMRRLQKEVLAHEAAAGAATVVQPSKLLGLGGGGGGGINEAEKARENLLESLKKENAALELQRAKLTMTAEEFERYETSQKRTQDLAKGTSKEILLEIDRREKLTRVLREQIQAQSDLAGVIRAETLSKGPQEDTRGLRSFAELREAQEAIDKDAMEERAERAKAQADLEESIFRLQLEDTRKAVDAQKRVWADLQTSLERGWDQTLQGLFSGTQSFSDSMKNIFRNMVVSILSELGKLAINNLFGSSQNQIGPLLANGQFFSGGGGGGGGGGLWDSIKKIFGFDEGGIVPGRIGAPQMIMAHGGETILPTHKGGNFGGNVYNIDARGAQRGVSDEIRRAIAQSESRAVNRSVSAVRDERRNSTNFAKVFRNG